MSESIIDQIHKVQEEIRSTPYHKATEHHIGSLKAKLARLRDQLYFPSKKSGDKRGFAIKKQGNATVAFLGFPSVGKSTLLNKLTNAKSKVAPYDFTTQTVIPGMMHYKGALIQLLDLPGIIEKAAEGKGHGKQIFSILRGVDLICIIIDVTKLWQKKVIFDQLYQAGLRINTETPKIKIKKQMQGGIKITSSYAISKEVKSTIYDIAKNFNLTNGEIIIREPFSYDCLIDAFSLSRVYCTAVTIYNKADILKNINLLLLENEILISAKFDSDLTDLKELLFKSLKLIRVYLKPKGQDIDLENPLIIKSGATVFDAVQKVSQELASKINYALLWGKDAKFKGQKVNASYKLVDESIITFV